MTNFLLFVFLLHNDVYFEHTQSCKKMAIEILKDFLSENYFRRIETVAIQQKIERKKILFFANELTNNC